MLTLMIDMLMLNLDLGVYAGVVDMRVLSLICCFLNEP